MNWRMLLLVMSLVGGPLAASAQGSATNAGAKGWFIGLGLNGSSLSAEDEDAESGGGVTLQGGYGFTRNLAIFLEGTASAMQTDGESWVLSHGDLGLRYHFSGEGRRFVPFVEGALSGWAGQQDDAEFGNQQGELEISGSAFTFGGGFLYFFGRRTAFSAQLKFSNGEFNKVRFENVTVDGFDIDANSARLNLGVTWFLGGGR